MMDDDKIIELFWCRDNAAIEQTAAKYSTYLRKIAKNILNDPSDEEECLNDALLRLWQSIPPNRPDNFLHYASKLVRNIAFDRYKQKNAAKRGGGEISLVLDELSEIVSNRDTPENELDRKELIGAINDFLSSLERGKRSYFICRYWRAMPVKEIAKKYRRSENYISVSLGRTRAKMKEYLTERGFEV